MSKQQVYTGFDLEIVKEIPEGEEWAWHRPLGISCAVLWDSDVLRPMRHWASLHGSAVMPLQAKGLVQDLQEKVNRGYTIVTWNGLGFDFDVLTEESGLYEECRELALGHVDMMFHLFCVKGFPLGLDTAAKGMGLAGKTEGVKGADAPRMWREGRRKEVLDYCAQDVRTTVDLARACTNRGGLQWVSNSGRINVLNLPGGWLTVRECLEFPEPDTSWMGNPWDRSKFTGWLTNHGSPSPHASHDGETRRA